MFTLLGPPLGSLVFLVPTRLILHPVVLLIFIFAYAMGGLAALVTGVAAALMARARLGALYLPGCALVGAAAQALFMFVIDHRSPDPNVSWAIIIAIAAGAALACALLTFRLARAHENMARPPPLNHIRAAYVLLAVLAAIMTWIVVELLLPPLAVFWAHR